ncbi:MAG: lasso peptide biosynthesis B2 protein [Acidimicrobiales bacterium]
MTTASGRLSTGAKVRLAAEIVWNLIRVRSLLRRSDLPTTLASLQRVNPNAAGPVTIQDARRLAHAVRRTLRVLPADTRCLTQSLVLTAVLARRGTTGALVIGVRPGNESGKDFGAHAWIELDGHPLLPTSNGEFERLVAL